MATWLNWIPITFFLVGAAIVFWLLQLRMNFRSGRRERRARVRFPLGTLLIHSLTFIFFLSYQFAWSHPTFLLSSALLVVVLIGSIVGRPRRESIRWVYRLWAGVMFGVLSAHLLVRVWQAASQPFSFSEQTLLATSIEFIHLCLRNTLAGAALASVLVAGLQLYYHLPQALREARHLWKSDKEFLSAQIDSPQVPFLFAIAALLFHGLPLLMIREFTEIGREVPFDVALVISPFLLARIHRRWLQRANAVPMMDTSDTPLARLKRSSLHRRNTAENSSKRKSRDQRVS